MRLKHEPKSQEIVVSREVVGDSSGGEQKHTSAPNPIGLLSLEIVEEIVVSPTTSRETTIPTPKPQTRSKHQEIVVSREVVGDSTGGDQKVQQTAELTSALCDGRADQADNLLLQGTAHPPSTPTPITEMCSGSEAGSYLRLIDFKAHSGFYGS